MLVLCILVVALIVLLISHLTKHVDASYIKKKECTTHIRAAAEQNSSIRAGDMLQRNDDGIITKLEYHSGPMSYLVDIQENNFGSHLHTTVDNNVKTDVYQKIIIVSVFRCNSFGLLHYLPFASDELVCVILNKGVLFIRIAATQCVWYGDVTSTWARSKKQTLVNMCCELCETRKLSMHGVLMSCRVHQVSKVLPHHIMSLREVDLLDVFSKEPNEVDIKILNKKKYILYDNAELACFCNRVPNTLSWRVSLSDKDLRNVNVIVISAHIAVWQGQQRKFTIFKNACGTLLLSVTLYCTWRPTDFITVNNVGELDVFVLSGVNTASYVVCGFILCKQLNENSKFLGFSKRNCILSAITDQADVEQGVFKLCTYNNAAHLVKIDRFLIWMNLDSKVLKDYTIIASRVRNDLIQVHSL